MTHFSLIDFLRIAAAVREDASRRRRSGECAAISIAGDTSVGQGMRPAPAVLRVLMPLLTTALAFSPAGQAGAEAYLLQRGDVIALSVAGVPGLQGNLPVDIDGNVAAPLVGTISAAGRSLDSVADEIRMGLANVRYTVQGPAGDAVAVEISPHQVSVGIGAYSPIFVDGDVRNPGSFPFSPVLTAQRAISLAGGFGLASMRDSNPAPRILALQTELRDIDLQADAARQRIARIHATLATEENGADRLGGVERQVFGLQREKAAVSADHFAASMTQTRHQIAALTEQARNEEEGWQADMEDYQRVLAARDTGSITASRFADVRRNLLYATISKLQTGAELTRTELALGDLQHELTQGQLDEKARLLTQLGEEMLAIERFEARMGGIKRELLYLDGAATATEAATEVRIVVSRADGSSHALPAGADVSLRPGDLVRIQVQTLSDED